MASRTRAFDRMRRPSKQLERLRRYDWFLASGWRESRYASLDIEPAALIVCDEERQVEAFVSAADGHLSAVVAGPGRVDFVGREQVGFTSWARVLEADDRVDQVRARPSDMMRRSPQERARLKALVNGTQRDDGDEQIAA
ncbi:MAG: hypothetical protein JWQ48_1190 [Conexibacter sp.]|nr:hypothetical protein [Conexibacter sp.]